MNSELVKKVVEAALMVAEKPLTPQQLVGLFDPAEQEENLLGAVHAALEEIEADYAHRGIELKRVASGYRIQSRAEVAPWVNRLWEEKPARYSRAVLETLAIIAYRQPITRGEIEDIRGVAVSSHIIKTLSEREWVKVAGHRDVPGRPAVYVTTGEFLDYFNLKSLADLPVLSEPGDIESLSERLSAQSVDAEVPDESGDTVKDHPAPVTASDEPEPATCAPDANRVEEIADGEREQAKVDAETAMGMLGGTEMVQQSVMLADLDTMSADAITTQIALAEAAVDRDDDDDSEALGVRSVGSSTSA